MHRLDSVLGFLVAGELHERTALREAIGPLQDRAFFDEAKRREKLPNILLRLLLVQHADEQLSVFNS